MTLFHYVYPVFGPYTIVFPSVFLYFPIRFSCNIVLLAYCIILLLLLFLRDFTFINLQMNNDGERPMATAIGVVTSFVTQLGDDLSLRTEDYVMECVINVLQDIQPDDVEVYGNPFSNFLNAHDFSYFVNEITSSHYLRGTVAIYNFLALAAGFGTKSIKCSAFRDGEEHLHNDFNDGVRDMVIGCERSGTSRGRRKRPDVRPPIGPPNRNASVPPLQNDAVSAAAASAPVIGPNLAPDAPNAPDGGAAAAAAAPAVVAQGAQNDPADDVQSEADNAPLKQSDKRHGCLVEATVRHKAVGHGNTVYYMHLKDDARLLNHNHGVADNHGRVTFQLCIRQSEAISRFILRSKSLSNHIKTHAERFLPLRDIRLKDPFHRIMRYLNSDTLENHHASVSPKYDPTIRALKARLQADPHTFYRFSSRVGTATVPVESDPPHHYYRQGFCLGHLLLVHEADAPLDPAALQVRHLRRHLRPRPREHGPHGLRQHQRRQSYCYPRPGSS